MKKYIQLKKRKMTPIKNINRNDIFNIFVLIVFIFLTSLVAHTHEYWADEAQAWLLARDASVIELLTKYLHSEGHPILWFLVIKVFQMFGLSYENFNLISIIFSSLGVALFLFKSNFKWYIKLLLPFTYFVFYQYTIIARGYCLIFFILSCLAIIWDKREKYYGLFTVLLILLINLEAHTFLLSGSIYLLEIYGYIKNKNNTNKKILIYLIILFFAFLFTTLYVFPYKTTDFNVVGEIYYVSNSFITNNTYSGSIKGLISVLLLVLMYFIYFKQKKYKFIEFNLLFFIPIIFMLIKYCALWHFGIPFLIFIFIIWIQKIYDIKIIKMILVISCIFQVFYSYKSSIFEINNIYSPSKEVSDFIKQYNYENLKIYANRFHPVSLNPYFEKNIYNNYEKNISFFYLDKTNIFFKIPIDQDSIIKDNVDIFINTGNNNNYNKLLEYYNLYEFKGNLYFENHQHVALSIYVYVKKSIDFM